MFQMQDFENYKRPKKSICAGLRAMVSTPPKLSFCAFFLIFFKKCFKKKFKKNALDIIRVLFKDKSITIDIVPELKNFLDISWGVTPFCKIKGSQKLDPTWIFFCCEPLKCSGLNKILSENILLKKLKQKHANITVIKNIFDKQISLSLIVHT